MGAWILLFCILPAIYNCHDAVAGQCKYKDNKFGFPQKIGVISADSSPKTDSIEIIGLASHSIFKDILYFVDEADPDDQVTVYAINAWNGNIIGTITITDANILNLFDLSSGVCPDPIKGYCIYVHDYVNQIVHVIKEEENPGTSVVKASDVTMAYTIPDLIFNSYTRAIIVDCHGTVYFLDESTSFFGRETRLMKLMEELGNPGSYIAKTITILDIPTAEEGAKGASLSHDCSQLLVKTLDKVYLFPWNDGHIKAKEMQLLPSVSLEHGYSITWALDQSGYFTVNAVNPAPLFFSPKVKTMPESKFSLGTVVGEVNWFNEIDDFSGMAASRDHPGFVYLIEDGINGADFIAITQIVQGQRAAKIEPDSALNLDWEDIAVGPCPADFSPAEAKNCIYVHETSSGGKGIYVFAEPDDPYVGYTINTIDVTKLTYTTVVNFNGNAIMVGCDGKIYLIDNTRDDPTKVLRLFKTGTNQYGTEVIATFVFSSISSGPQTADMSPCCDEILLKYNDQIILYKVEDNDVVAAFLEEPTVLPYIPEKEAEAIAWMADCKCYLTIERVKNKQAPLRKYCRLPSCEKPK